MILAKRPRSSWRRINKRLIQAKVVGNEEFKFSIIEEREPLNAWGVMT